MMFAPRFSSPLQPFISRALTVVLAASFLFPPGSSAKNSAQQQPAAGAAFQLGLTALKENRLQEALQNFTQAETEHPNDPLIHNFRGIALVGLGQNAEAASEYRQALQLNPQMEDAYKNLGFLQWTQHQLDAAHDSLQHAVALNAADSFAHYYLGRVHLDAQRYESALQELQISKVPPPTDPDFSMQLTNAYLTVGRREDASKILQQISATNLDERQSVRLAALLIEARQNDQALAVVQHLSANAPWREFDLVLVHLLAGKYQQAVGQAESYKKSLALKNENPITSAQVWTVIGIAYSHLHQNDRSIEAFRQAATLEPANEEYALNLSRELMDLSRYADATSATESALAANPKSYALHLRLGAAQLVAGHYSEAESVFRELVNAGDPLPTGYVGLAQVLLRTGRAGEAITELTAAQKRLGPTFLVSYFLGLAYERNNNPQQAAAAFQEALSLNPANTEAHLSLGKTLLGLSKLNDAIAQLQETLHLDPANDQAKRLLSKAYARAGDTKRATELAQPNKDPQPIVVSRPKEVPHPVVDQQAVVVQQPVVVQHQVVNAQPVADPQATSPTEDLLGDFFVPAWQFPAENAH